MKSLKRVLIFLVQHSPLCVLVLGGCSPSSTVTYIETDELVTGTAVVSLQEGLSDNVAFEVPNHTESLLIEVEGNGNLYYLTEMLTPLGRDLIESAGIVTREAREIPGFVSWGFPNGEEGGVQRGSYQLLFRGTTRDGDRVSQDTLTASLLMKKEMPGPQCALEIDFIVATDAIYEEDLEEAIERLAIRVAEIFSPAGVLLQQYGLAQAVFPTITVEEDGNLFEATRAVGDILKDALGDDRARVDALHVFLVRSMGMGINGYSLGLPGPYSGDWPSAGVLVATTQFASEEGEEIYLSPEDMAVSTAHEIGHYLGLYHTSERMGGAHDPISDTPECEPGAPECNTDDFTKNLMTPGGSLERYLLTPGQANVMRRHPLCRANP